MTLCRPKARNVSSRHSIRGCAAGRTRDLRQCPLAERAASRSSHRQLRALRHLGTVVRRRAARILGDEFSVRPVAAAEAFSAGPVGWNHLQPAAAGKLQVSSRVSRFPSLRLAAEVLAHRSAARDFVLDVPGDELPPGPVSRRGTRSIVRGVCVVHGVLSGGDLRADLPHARDASAVSLRRTGATRQHGARPFPNCYRGADDAVGPTAGARHSQRRRNQWRIRSRHAVERAGRLVPGVRIRTAAFPGLRRLLAYRHRRREDAGLHSAGKLRSSLRVHNALDFLDALAHVAIVLDPRLCFPSAGDVTARDVVAKSGARDFDGALRRVAQSQPAVRAVGLLSRRAARPAPPSTAIAAKVSLGAANCALDAAFVDRNYGPNQYGLAVLPGQFPAASRPDAYCGAVACYLSHTLSSSDAVSAGADPRTRIRGWAAGHRSPRSLRGAPGSDRGDAAFGGDYDHGARPLGVVGAVVCIRNADCDLVGHTRAKRGRVAVCLSVLLRLRVKQVLNTETPLPVADDRYFGLPCQEYCHAAETFW